MKITNALLLRLAVLTAVLTAVTLLVYRRDGAPAAGGFVPGAPLVQGLDTELAAKIIIREKRKNADGYDTVTLTARDGGYTVNERGGYPADNEEINVLLRTLQDIRTAAFLADSPAANPEFGVSPSAPATGDVVFQNRDGREILKVTVGGQNGRGHSVTTGKEVYRSETPVDFRGQPLSYIDQTVLRLDSKKVRSLAVARDDGEKFTFTARDGVLKLAAVPAGKVEEDNVTWSLKEGMTGLMFDDVAPAASPLQLRKKLSATLTLEDGGVYHLDLFQDPAEAYFATASADEPARGGLTPEKVVVLNDAVRFNRTHKGWRFAISKWDGERLDKPLAALLKDAPKTETPPAETGKAAAPQAPAAQPEAPKTPAPQAPAAPAPAP